MIDAVMLDSGPLGKIVHPRPNPEILAWVERLLGAGTRVIVPEIIDYELRRELLHMDFSTSVARLDQLKTELEYLPLDTDTMVKAAELWADARKRHLPTCDRKELDGDAILAAQAIQLRQTLQLEAIVATENIGHLSLWVDARAWQDINP